MLQKIALCALHLLNNNKSLYMKSFAYYYSKFLTALNPLMNFLIEESVKTLITTTSEKEKRNVFLLLHHLFICLTNLQETND